MHDRCDPGPRAARQPERRPLPGRCQNQGRRLLAAPASCLIPLPANGGGCRQRACCAPMGKGPPPTTHFVPPQRYFAAGVAAGGAGWLASTFNSIRTSLLTTTPLLKGRFQATPKSWRLMVRAAFAACSFPLCPATGPINSKGRSTSLETPRMVSAPCATKPLPFFSTDLLWNVISGKLAASKKSGDFRCLSRASTSVVMLAVLMVTLTDDLDGSLSS